MASTALLNRQVRLAAARHRTQGGAALILVLVMLVVIGFTSASAIRSATSGERITNNARMQNLAQQYAEAALRYCETELAKADANRVNTLKDIAIVQTSLANYDSPAWKNTTTWVGTPGSGGASNSRTTLPESQIKSANSAFRPAVLPQCAVERQELASGAFVHVVTARGFSPDYRADPTTGVTVSGSVVWLQSIFSAN